MWRIGIASLLVGGCDSTDCSIEARAALVDPDVHDCGVFVAETFSNDEAQRLAVRDCALAAVAEQRPFVAVWERQGIEYPIREALGGAFVDGVWAIRYYQWIGGTLSGDSNDSSVAWNCVSFTDLGADCMWGGVDTAGRLCIECARDTEVDRCSDR